LEIVGCKSAAAVYFLPSFCSMAGLWGCKGGKNCPRLGPLWVKSSVFGIDGSKSDSLLG
jgi:hypothetical protein